MDFCSKEQHNIQRLNHKLQTSQGKREFLRNVKLLKKDESQFIIANWINDNYDRLNTLCDSATYLCIQLKTHPSLKNISIRLENRLKNVNSPTSMLSLFNDILNDDDDKLLENAQTLLKTLSDVGRCRKLINNL